MKYQFIEQYKQGFPVAVMCQVLGVSRSADSMPGASVPPVDANKKMLNSPPRSDRYLRAIKRGMGVHVFMLKRSDQGISCSRKRVARLMREAGMSAKRKRRRVFTTRRDASHPVAPNLLAREFTATEPNTKWVSDVTYIPTLQGWLYLAVILDVYSRAVVGWSMSAHCDKAVVGNALLMALSRRRPKAGLLHHSDRGCQYTSTVYRKRLEQAGMIASMSRKGNCWDNALMESFFGSLKEECIGNMTYQSHQQARLSLFEYLEIYYNRQRRHSTLGYVSPLIYEQRRKQLVDSTV